MGSTGGRLASPLALVLLLLITAEVGAISLRSHATIGRNQELYKKYRQYSPFYLRSHPEEHHQGDISEIQGLAETAGFSDMKGVENVFEKNLGSFEHLMKGPGGPKETSRQELASIDDQIEVEQQIPLTPKKASTSQKKSRLPDNDSFLLEGNEEHILMQVESGEKALAELKQKLREQAEQELKQHESQFI